MNNNISIMTNPIPTQLHQFNSCDNPLTISSIRLAKMLERVGSGKNLHSSIKMKIEEFSDYQAITFSKTVEKYETGVEETVYHIGERESLILVALFYQDSIFALIDEWILIDEEATEQNITCDKTFMSSRDIADLAGKAHYHVMRAIEKLIDQGLIQQSNFELSAYKQPMPRGGHKDIQFYNLDLDATMVLIKGYDAHRRKAIIKRWGERESGKQRTLKFWKGRE